MVAAQNQGEVVMACTFQVDRTVFEHALLGAQNVAQKRTATPILTNVRLDARGDGLYMYATDYDLGIHQMIPAQVKQQGTAALPARMLYDIVKRSPGDTIAVDVDESHHGELKTAARGRYKLHGLDPADFPEPHKIAGQARLKLDRALFALWLRKTLFAASTDESRAALAGIFLESAGGRDLRFVATDTHRLVLQTVEKAGQEGILPADGIILPRKAIQELLRVVDGEGDAEIAVDPPHISVSWDHTVFMFRTVDGRFPSYRTVIPETTSRTAMVQRQLLIDAIDRVSLVVTDRFKCVTLRFENGALTLFAKNPDTGEAEEHLDCEYDGNSLDVGFNAQYLREAMAEITTARVELKLIDDVSPTLIYGEGDPTYLNVIMPMRI